ncbi:glutathione S-transferase S1 isoform X2 [Folsomia candida]|uniref:glutathione transferase n=1 Tax=Folsomia candida TaxID=158441 RepID=A0A226E9C5_FOLCA|nr:glutathione S-transferase S1 isoform X2 [Folsomia candida]OXA53714.1 Glutathione S-transferase S1 [Folsomia candida]
MPSATPWGQLPILEVDGKQLTQSSSISRFLGRTFNLCGENAWESAKCDEYVDATNDLINEWVGFRFNETDEARKAERKAKFIAELMPNCLQKLESIKEKNDGDYLVGKKLTWADIDVADKLQTLEDDINPTVLEGYPNLQKFKNAVFSLPRIAAYVEKSGYTYKGLDNCLGKA